jgi:hypothetical protein
VRRRRLCRIGYAAQGQETSFDREVAAGLAVMTGASAVLGLATGCTLMVHETRLAVQSLTKEAEIWKQQARKGNLG